MSGETVTRVHSRGLADVVSDGNSTGEEIADRGGIQVIARAVAIMRALEGESAGLSLGELASRVGLARSTVQRIVRALVDEQILMPAGPLARVKLGPLLVRLAADVTLDVVQLVRPILESLSLELDETVDLSMPDGDRALFIDQVVGSQRLAAVSKIGEGFPLHSTANGKALLAAVDDKSFAQMTRGALPADTASTITSLDDLRAQVDEIARSFIAFDRDEHTVGVSAVGTWFRDAAGRAYALSIPVPSVRFDDGRRLIEPLLAARQRILRALASDGK